jgi:hypothetical protein
MMHVVSLLVPALLAAAIETAPVEKDDVKKAVLAKKWRR